MKISIVLCGYGDEIRAALHEAPGQPSATPRSYRRLQQPEWTATELGVDRTNARSLVGNIYRGRVVNVVPALEAVFVDIGLERNGFLHQRELLGNGPVQKQVRAGDEILVQVIRDAIKTKGPRLSQNISLVGRSLVWMPFGSGVGVSRKLTDKQRTQFRGMLQDKIDGGVIVRTAGTTQTVAGFDAEIAYLSEIWKTIQATTQSPICAYSEPSIGVRWLREIRVGELDSVYSDHPRIAAEIQEFLARTDPEQASRVQVVPSGVWEETGSQAAWDSVFETDVSLPAGGSIVMSPTEAMTVVDVNSGSFVKGKGLKETILKTNLQAADAVAEQIRLRDVGGLIVVDFIDMESADHRSQVEERFRAALERDRARWTASAISELGLVEMSRQNLAASVRDLVSEPCQCCGGQGIVISAVTTARELWRGLRLHPPEGECVHVQAPEEVIEWLTHGSVDRLAEVQEDCGKQLVFSRGSLKILDSGSYDDMIAQAAPIHVGEEIWVKINEPHMYNPDDAVAKIGDYPVTVYSGLPCVGQGAMLRVTELLPAHARAVIISEPREIHVQSMTVPATLDEPVVDTTSTS